MTYVANDPFVLSQVFKLVAHEVRRARSRKDLLERLENRGYGLRKTPHGPMLVTMPQGVELGPLPTA